jgi:hypothetical protein
MAWNEIPALAGNPRIYRLKPRRRVELCKPEVTGSIPVRSIIDRSPLRLRRSMTTSVDFFF